MNVFDIVIIVLLLLAFVRGIMNGLFSEIASLVAVVVGVYVAIHYANYVEFYLVNSTFVEWSDQTNKIVAFVITFLVVVLLILFIGKILTKIADITALGLLNKVLGGVFGVLKIALILSIILIFFNRVNNTIPFITAEMLDTSTLYHPIKKIAPELFPSIIREDKDGKTTIELPK
ncbi:MULTISPECIES: CvpA family protein [unclassified Polaribacter]|uniref:CvpA family protein n=1 Tax=unclassified Polaribacter TaxID=196858 RepID=UPI0011BD956B|nr:MULTISPECIES: CvpA family protein [unclassified Polaribacter]TXD53505.1 CvpA family protein [Polaribacter sp. IC063]TXD58347.1 CvpA family protein [Polaribacter sp. IC066]